jgi:transcriptional regulator with XRE-family HTH domain
MTFGQREASKPIRASDAVAALVKQLRLRRGVTVKDLAGKCRDLGAEQLTANVLTNIEVRRRDVSVDELLVLALALDVAPAYLLTPGDASTSIAVTASEVHPADAVEQWILGTAPLLSSGSTPYVQYAIERAAGRGQQTDHASALLRARTSGLVEQYEAEAQLFLGKVRNQVVDLVDFLHESVTNGVPADELALVLESVKNRVSPPPSVTEAQTATRPIPTNGN